MSVPSISCGTPSEYHGLAVDGREIRVTVHDLVPHFLEFADWQALSKEVSQVFRSGDVGDSDLAILDCLADKEMASLDMLHTVMMLGIIGQGYGCSVIASKHEWFT
jgi:hypothetical protein